MYIEKQENETVAMERSPCVCQAILAVSVVIFIHYYGNTKYCILLASQWATYVSMGTNQEFMSSPLVHVQYVYIYMYMYMDNTYNAILYYTLLYILPICYRILCKMMAEHSLQV